jgi:UDP-4-amino-4-deoxy-L-arabinose formyltransferase/UDP-glucuronic acid dehydrogenase (UDP-4-keto-hexauronic acid decarboxylating)
VKILLVAEESAGIRTLRALSALPHEIVGVCTGAAREGMRGATVAGLAGQLGLATWPARSVTEAAFGSELRQLGLDLILNLHSLYRIHPDVLAAARIGGFNLHPGPLPRYAGLNAPSWAIYRGETRHGVTLHWLADGIDRGDIAWLEEFDIGEQDTALTVSARCLQLGIPLVQRLVETAASRPGDIPRRPQDPLLWHYYGAEVPQDGRLDFGRPARDVVNFIRACDYHPLPSPWGTPLALLEGREVRVLKAERTGRPAAGPPGTLSGSLAAGAEVATADEWVRLLKLA